MRGPRKLCSLGRPRKQRGPPNGAPAAACAQGGGNINDFQQKTYAKIQLSKASEYFPGTVERILMLTGRLKQVRGGPGRGGAGRPGRAERSAGPAG